MNLAEAKSRVGEKSPVFDAPPVVETALGVRFAPLEGFGLVHLGQLLEAYGGVYDRAEMKLPVHADVQQLIGMLQDFASSDANIPLRCWYVTKDQSQLVQVQGNMFMRNWRATEEKKEYQHYEGIRPLFVRDWRIFCKFLQDRDMKRPSVWQWEVTYFNHLVRGREWQTFADVAAIFPVWRGVKTGNVFDSVDSASFSVTFRLPDENGRIQFTLQPGVRHDGAEILQLTVTAQGQPVDQNDDALLECLDYGHLAVVNGFVQFVSEDALRMWRHR